MKMLTAVRVSVGDPNILYLNPDPEICPIWFRIRIQDPILVWIRFQYFSHSLIKNGGKVFNKFILYKHLLKKYINIPNVPGIKMENFCMSEKLFLPF